MFSLIQVKYVQPQEVLNEKVSYKLPKNNNIL